MNRCGAQQHCPHHCHCCQYHRWLLLLWPNCRHHHINIHPRHSSVWRFSHHRDLCPVLILQNIWSWLRCRKTGRLAANYECTQCEAWWWVGGGWCTQAAHTLDSQPAVLQRCLRCIAYVLWCTRSWLNWPQRGNDHQCAPSTTSAADFRLH